MFLLRCVLLASAPALFWLWLYYRRDRWEPEPKLLVLKLFLYGAVAAVPAYYVEAILPGPRGNSAYDAFLRIALVEELAKLLVVWWFAYRHAEFNEPMDGIIYAVAAALGFATVENVFYALVHGDRLILYRSFTSSLAHVGFSGLVGYELGRAKFGKGNVLFALAAVTGLHGIYDLLIGRWTVVLVIPFVLVLLWLAMRRADEASPFRPAG